MASVVNDGNGRRRIQLVARDGSRKSIRLGKMNAEQAEGVKVHIEDLQAVQVTGRMDRKLAEWLNDINDVLHERIAAIDLVEPRTPFTVGAWLDYFYEARRADLKPKSLRKLQDTGDKLRAILGERVSLRKITERHAAEWRQELQKNLSTASVRTNCGNAKAIFGEAVRRKIIPENPFRHLESGPTASANARYVTPAEAETFIAALPDAQSKLMFGLARYGGLRVPSESHILTLAHVDYERCRMRVRSPKTERHEGHKERTVPIRPELMKLLLARQEELKEGESLFITQKGQASRWRLARRAWKRSGVERWDDLFQTLRSSAEKHWANDGVPQYAASAFVGHSLEISGRHYVNAVPDEVFAMAARGSVQNQAQHHGADAGEASHPRNEKCGFPQENAPSCKVAQEKRVSDGIRTRDP
jgi:integrase